MTLLTNHGRDLPLFVWLMIHAMWVWAGFALTFGVWCIIYGIREHSNKRRRRT